jgi:hypothetical protein
MYKIELFIWHNRGLQVKSFKRPTSREAMDYAYSQKWDVMKVYDIDGDLMHVNSVNKQYEQYA